ncbi:LAME_0E03620g1_1 [Lachancea meyersii CBS 8951]|uniref:Protein ARV n=1 Tax=Lachancea meyersii CBS 8951 TaxID=1266667 RepID=A0A1G4JGQ9_9SACH|nr:LAME_0E03620g1_1 [Lachancea meyersii CBS 8951]
MICINCCGEVECLYVRYSNDHIRLTDCPNCRDVADRYVEIDNVLLFIDLLLLKPGAYRHLVYNSLELELSKFPGTEQNGENSKNGFKNALWAQARRLKNWFVKFDKLNRVWLIITAFEVYLTWVSEERRFQAQKTDSRGLLMRQILSKSALAQYLYFTVYCVVDFMVLHNVAYFLLVRLFKWGCRVKYAKYVISYTILLSYGAKIYPILMLIWPYDTILTTSIIKIVANVYIVEALKVVTNRSYFDIIVLYFMVFVARSLTVKPLLSLLVTKGNFALCLHYAKTELQLVHLDLLPSSFRNGSPDL